MAVNSHLLVLLVVVACFFVAFFDVVHVYFALLVVAYFVFGLLTYLPLKFC